MVHHNNRSFNTHNGDGMKHELVKQNSMNGRYIRLVSRVTLEDGTVITFMDRMSKKEAFRQALLRGK